MAVNESLAQRLVVRHHVDGLAEDEVEPYIRHRLHLAGAPDVVLFEANAVTAIAQASHGLPRRVNQIAHNALAAAVAMRSLTGAIDLVIHGRDCRFAEAVLWLKSQTIPAAATPGPTAKAPFRPPVPCNAAWPQVRAWLSGARGLHVRDLDNAHAAGSLYADARNNAVFPCTNAAGAVTGAEIVSQRFRGMAPGSRKNRGGVHFPGPQTARGATILITESAIDALSARTLLAAAPVALYASTAGVCQSLPDWILDLKPERILCAFDSDDAGDNAARTLIASDPRIQRLRPSAAKDWNDILRMTASAEER